MSIQLVPLREVDVPQALNFIVESSEWAPQAPNWAVPMEVLGTPNSKWYSALLNDEFMGVVGFCGISWPDGSADVALGVPQPLRGCGMAKTLAKIQNKYAFEELRLHRLQMVALTDSPSCAIARSAGLTLEGTLKACRYKGGEWRDASVYAILKEN